MRSLLIIVFVINIGFALQRGGFGGFAVDLALPTVGEINTKFSRHQIPELSGRLFGIGGAGFGIVNQIVIGGEGYSAREIVESDSIHAEFSIAAGEFKIGYNLIGSRYFNGAITTGFGGICYRLKLRPRLEDVSFDDLLEDPERYVVMESRHFLIHPEAMMVFSIPYQPISFLHIGISAGVNLNIFPQEWEYEDLKVLNSPKFGVVTPVLSVKFLLGGGV